MNVVIFRVLLFVFCFCLLNCSQKSQRQFPLFEYDNQCYGDKKAKNNLVYLHGYDSDKPGWQEKRNRENLFKLASILDLRIAFPRSPKSCQRKGKFQRCWSRSMAKNEAKESLQIANRAAAECFSNKNKNFGILAFSNAGYLAVKMLTHCLLPSFATKAKYIVTVGSAKLWGSVGRGGSLKNCRPISFLVGKKDKYNYEGSQRYFQKLEKRGAQISIVVFQGGHEVPFGPTLAALRKYLN